MKSTHIKNFLMALAGVVAIAAAFWFHSAFNKEKVVYVEIPVLAHDLPPNTMLQPSDITSKQLDQKAFEALIKMGNDSGNTLLTFDNLADVVNKRKSATYITTGTPLFVSYFVPLDVDVIPELSDKDVFVINLKEVGIELPPNADPFMGKMDLCFNIDTPELWDKFRALRADELLNYESSLMVCPIQNVEVKPLLDGMPVSNAYVLDAKGKLHPPSITEANELAIIVGTKETDRDIVQERRALISTWLTFLANNRVNVTPMLFLGDEGEDSVFITNMQDLGNPMYHAMFAVSGQIDPYQKFGEALEMQPLPEGYYYDPVTGEIYYAGFVPPTPTPTPTPTALPFGYEATPTPTPTPTPEG